MPRFLSCLWFNSRVAENNLEKDKLALYAANNKINFLFHFAGKGHYALEFLVIYLKIKMMKDHCTYSC